jgi:hypothetical protein
MIEQPGGGAEKDFRFWIGLKIEQAPHFQSSIFNL